MKMILNIFSVPGNKNSVVRLMISIKEKVANLFEPEEVEVTFKMKGDKLSYTYTKVARKQVA